MSEQPEVRTETRLARRNPGLMPTTWDQWKEQATFAAGSGIVPTEFAANPAACLIAMQFGASVGLDPMQALQSVKVVNGRPSLFGDSLLALCQSHPDWDRAAFKEWTEGNGEAYTACCQVGRLGYAAPVIGRFSVAEAIRAKLWGKKGPWVEYPARMLQMRARAFALRNLYADVLSGISIAEEVQDYAPEPAKASPANGPKVVVSQTLGTPGMPLPTLGQPAAQPQPPEPPPTRADAIAQRLASQMPEVAPNPEAYAKAAENPANALIPGA